MSRIFFYILMVLGFQSFGQSDTLDLESDAQIEIFIEDENRYNLKNNNEFVGKDTVIIKYHNDSDIKSKAKYAIDSEGRLSDLIIGDYLEYYPNGNIKSKGKFQISKYIECGIVPFYEYYNYRIGYWEFFYSDGSISAKGNFKLAKLNLGTNCEGGDDIFFGITDNSWRFYSNGMAIQPTNEILEDIEFVKYNFAFGVDGVYKFERKSNKIIKEIY